MKTLETIAQECAEKVLHEHLYGEGIANATPIIAAAIREATEQEFATINAERAESRDTLKEMIKAQDEVAQLRAEVEHIKAWGNAKVEELDHYKRVFKSNGRSMELMAARIPTGHDVIDAVIEASAVSADSPGVLVWSANAPEQIEAALARIAATRNNNSAEQ